MPTAAYLSEFKRIPYPYRYELFTFVIMIYVTLVCLRSKKSETKKQGFGSYIDYVFFTVYELDEELANAVMHYVMTSNKFCCVVFLHHICLLN